MDEERPIEKLLRRYARKRKDDAGAPLELHPATRRLLQEEVSRQYPTANKKKAAFSGWLVALRGRWVYATAAFSAVVIAAVIVVTDKNSETSLAKNKDHTNQPLNLTGASDKEQLQADKPEAQYAKGLEVPSPAASPQPQRADEFKTGSAEALALKLDANGAKDGKSANTAKTPAEDAVIAASGARQEPAGTVVGKKFEDAAAVLQSPTQAPAIATPAPASGSLYSGSAVTSRRMAQPEKSARTSGAPATLAPTSPTPSARSRSVDSAYFSAANLDDLNRNHTQELSQSFVNNATSQPVDRDKSKAVATVLTRFQIQQNGNRLRVIDADGSTYLGEMEAVAVGENATDRKGAEALKTFKKQAPRSDTALTTQNGQNYFYRVAGTNRTLNQNVTFTWNFLESTNVTLTNALSLGGALREVESNGKELPSLLNNSGISGRIQVDQTKEIPINAVPSTPQ
jgi:hypothetical protein